MVVKLQVIQGETSRNEVTLRRPRTVVGRKKGCKIRIRSELVSRIHCSLVLQDGRLIVKDLGSSNGTFVNGVRIKQSVLQAGDTIQVGPIKFVVQIIGTPASDERPATEVPRTLAVPMDGDQVVFVAEEDPVADDLGNLLEAEVLEVDLENVEFVPPNGTHAAVSPAEDIFNPDEAGVLNADDFIVPDSQLDENGYKLSDEPRPTRKPSGP